MRSAVILVPAAICLACSGSQRPPGDEVMGTFNFTATPVFLSCTLTEVPSDGFTFEATFSRNKSPGTEAFITSFGSSRAATFDGQFVASELVAPRTFTNRMVSCGSINVDRTNLGALLSASQAALLTSTCPSTDVLFDGGIPGPDAGAALPSSQSSGFDAVHACGTLDDVTLPDAGNLCGGQCVLSYTVDGKRK